MPKELQGLLFTRIELCREDNTFILSHVSHSGVITEKNLVKIPLVYFHYHASVINRIIFDS